MNLTRIDSYVWSLRTTIDDFILTSNKLLPVGTMVANFFHFSDFHIPDKRGTLRATIDPFQRLEIEGLRIPLSEINHAPPF